MLIEKYIKYLRYEKNYSLHTEISYSEDLRQFACFIAEHFPDIEIQAVDSDIIRMWIVSLMENKISPRSVNRKLSSLKSFYRYLLRIGETTANPAKKVTGPKTTKPLPAFVSNGDMDSILDEVQESDSFESARDHLMIELFYTTGIRRAELIGLKDIDIDFSNKTILVTGKRNKQRVIPISDNILSQIKQYLETRNSETENQSGYLFVKKDGQQLYPMLAHRIVTEKLKQIPTLSKTSPHVLRHTFATGMLNNGADINAVKELLGHSSLAATEIYTHTSFEELKKIYNKAHPRA
ncbi:MULTISPECIES: tyrosine recombinase XerC [unclassified Dysgonomonas]|uniref:tyrosine recombinase XerC n=1 Tax=unclassified Dysgonomonas TaxID=2630389 RepID=UPI0024760281|nr:MULTISPECIES: tyrosine recombinase XerC [unclassified Dysgonomonas]